MVVLPGGPDPFDPALASLVDRPLVDLRAGLEDPHAPDDLLRPLGALPRPAAAVGPPLVCPYRGLEPFNEEDAALFFGRDEDVARLRAKLRRTRFLAVLGASGSGKSSLVRAGLVPALRAADPDLRVAVLSPGAAPLSALSAAAEGLAPDAPSPEDLRRDARALEAAVGRSGSALIVVDQFEEAFSLAPDVGDRRAFIESLLYAATAAGGATIVVLAMRSDFYPRLAEHSQLRALVAAQQYLVGPLEKEGLRHAIEEPARRTGLDLASHDGSSPTSLSGRARCRSSSTCSSNCGTAVAGGS
jgi:hypothetical protein